jgi:hypothetical protein
LALLASALNDPLPQRLPGIKLRGRLSKGGAMTRPLRIVVVLIGLGALVLAPRAAAQETPVVEIAPTARLLQGGKAVLVQVTVTCPTGAEVLEAFLYVNQDGNQGQLASFQPICDDTPHTFTVRARADGFRYHVGEAQVSAYVLLTSGASTSPGQIVTLQHRHS